MDDKIRHPASDKAKSEQPAEGQESLIQPVNLDV